MTPLEVAGVTVTIAEHEAITCPFAGLDPYTKARHRYFVGRERDSELIVANMYGSPLLVVYGPSGVGKSSVLLAGVVPKLESKPNVVTVVVRDWQSASFAANMKRDVAALLVKRGVELDPDALDKPLDDFLAHCTKRADATARLSEEDIWFFFLFDQFEEYFLYDATQRANGFDQELARTTTRSDLRAAFLICLREDEIARLDRLRHRIPGLLKNRFPLKHLSREDARKAIEEPMARFAEDFPELAVPKQIDAAVVESLLSSQVVFETSGLGRSADEKSGQDETRPIELPFLQLVLTKLWDYEVAQSSNRLRVKTYTMFGGASGIVRSYVAGVLDACNGEETRIAAAVFQYLVTPSGAKIAHLAADLAADVGASESKVAALLERLTGRAQILRRIVSRAADGREFVRYEIAHDSLAKAILAWRSEYAAERNLVRAWRRLAGAAAILIVLAVAVLEASRETRQSYDIRSLADRAIAALPRDPLAAQVLAVEVGKSAQWPLPLVRDGLARQAAESTLQKVLASTAVGAVPIPSRAPRSTFAAGDRALLVVALRTAALWSTDQRQVLFTASTPAVPISPISLFSRTLSLAGDAVGASILLGFGDSLLVWRGRDLRYGASPDTVIRFPSERIRSVGAVGTDSVLVRIDSSGSSNRAYLAGVNSWRFVRQLASKRDTIRGPKGAFAVIDDARTMRLVHLGSGRRRTLGSNDAITVGSFSVDGRWLAYTRSNLPFVLRLEPALRGEPIRLQSLAAQDSDAENSLSFSPRGRFLVIAADSAVAVYRTGDWTRPVWTDTGAVRAFSSDETEAIALLMHPRPRNPISRSQRDTVPRAAVRRTAALLNTVSWKVRDTFPDTLVTSAGFAKERALVWTRSLQAGLHLWRLSPLNELLAVPASADPTFSHDGTLFAVPSADSIVRVYRTAPSACGACAGLTLAELTTRVEGQISTIPDSVRQDVIRRH